MSDTVVPFFPLYDTLLDMELPSISEEDTCDILSKLNSKNASIIYAIIEHYYILQAMDKGVKLDQALVASCKKANKRSKKYTLPYKCTTMAGGKGVLCKWARLPEALQNMLKKVTHMISE